MRSIASRRAHAARAPHASRRTLRVLLSMTQAAKVGTTHGTVTLRSDAKHRVSKGRQSTVTLRSDAKHRVSKGHQSTVTLRSDAKHRVSKGAPKFCHPEERCEASR